MPGGQIRAKTEHQRTAKDGSDTKTVCHWVAHTPGMIGAPHGIMSIISDDASTAVKKTDSLSTFFPIRPRTPQRDSAHALSGPVAILADCR